MVPGSTYAGGTPYPTTNATTSIRSAPGAQGRAPADHALHPDRADVTNQVETFDATPIPRALVRTCRSWFPSRGSGGTHDEDPNRRRTPRSAGITLTEILISILILGIGLVSLATLFPIGLLRLREAQRQTRSAYLFESATADVAARGLLNANSFTYADLLNVPRTTPAGTWLGNPLGSVRYNPLIQDTPYYGGDPYDTANAGANPGASARHLWRLWPAVCLRSALAVLRRQAVTLQSGVYLDPLNLSRARVPVRLGQSTSATSISSAGSLRQQQPAPDGLQRLTNFNRLTSSAIAAAAIVIPTSSSPPRTWSGRSRPIRTTPSAFIGWSPLARPARSCRTLHIDARMSLRNDWRFSWMVTAQQTNGSNGAAFEGNIVIFENRPFGFDSSTGAGGGRDRGRGRLRAEQ